MGRVSEPLIGHRVAINAATVAVVAVIVIAASVAAVYYVGFRPGGPSVTSVTILHSTTTTTQETTSTSTTTSSTSASSQHTYTMNTTVPGSSLQGSPVLSSFALASATPPGPLTLFQDPQNGYVYAGSVGRLLVVDGTTLVGNISLVSQQGPAFPANYLFESSRNLIYVFASDQIWVLQGTQSLGPLNLGFSLALSSWVDDSQSGLVYVSGGRFSQSSSNLGPTILVINRTSVQEEFDIQPASPSLLPESYVPRLLLDPDDALVYATSPQLANLSSGPPLMVFHNGARIANLSVPCDVLTYDGTNGYVYAAGPTDGTIFVIDKTSVIARISAGQDSPCYNSPPAELLFDSFNGFVYGLPSPNSGNGCVWIVNGTRLAGGIEIASSGPEYWLANPSNGLVYLSAYTVSPSSPQTTELPEVLMLNGSIVQGNVTLGHAFYYGAMAFSYDSSSKYVYAYVLYTGKARWQADTYAVRPSASVLAFRGTSVVANITLPVSSWLGDYTPTFAFDSYAGRTYLLNYQEIMAGWSSLYELNNVTLTSLTLGSNALQGLLPSAFSPGALQVSQGLFQTVLTTSEGVYATFDLSYSVGGGLGYSCYYLLLLRPGG